MGQVRTGCTMGSPMMFPSASGGAMWVTIATDSRTAVYQSPLMKGGVGGIYIYMYIYIYIHIYI